MKSKLSEKATKQLFLFLDIILIILVSFIVVCPLMFANKYSGHDFVYHATAINSLNAAWENGSFGSKIYELICLDYGYGTGLFYSTVPASIAVVFMNVLHLPINFALGLEVFLIFFLSGMVVYLFANRLMKNRLASLVAAIVYMVFPYFITNVYIRFAYSELFVMLVLPLVVLGMYELIHNGNYRAFVPCFTIGVSLGILTHMTMTIYICIFVLIYICLNFKNFIKTRKWVPFLICSFIVLLITACFYVPMIYNLGVVDTNEMAYLGGWLWVSLLQAFADNYLIGSVLVIIAVYIVFFAIYHNKTSEEKQKEKRFFKITTFLVVWASPLFPWFLVLIKPFTMLQFGWRMFNFSALAVAGMVGYIVINLKKQSKSLLYCFMSAVFVVQGAVFIQESHKDQYCYTDRVFSLTETSVEFTNGMGTWKHPDYLPKCKNREYVFNRATENIVLDSNVYITEFANYQSLNEIEFLVNNSNSSYAVLKIPYDICNDIRIYQTMCDYPYKKEELAFGGIVKDESSYLKINFIDNYNSSKITISYNENSKLDEYLKENPFEFIVKQGDANFHNYVKTSASNYSVDVEVFEKSTIELPTLFYKGYSIKLITDNDEIELNPLHGENGLIEVDLEKSGTLKVEFNPTYIKLSNCVSIIGIVLLAVGTIVVFVVPKSFLKKIAKPRGSE